MTDTIQTLEDIRDDYAHERNAFQDSLAPMGEAAKYALWRERAQKKIDALNVAIRELNALPQFSH